MTDTDKKPRIRVDDPSRPRTALTGGSRLNAYTFDARELTLITDVKDPLYDKRIERTITRERVLEIALRGVETPITVRRREGKNIVSKGKQRTKTVHVVNAIAAGVPYTGSIKAVLHAIKEFSADEALVKQLVSFTKGKPLKIKAVAGNSGEDKDVRLSMRAENAHRDGDSLTERIKYVQEEHEKYGTSIEELAIAENVHTGTIRRWLKRDADATPVKAPKAKRPSMKAVIELAEQIGGDLTPRERSIVDFVNGVIDKEALLKLLKIKLVDAAE